MANLIKQIKINDIVYDIHDTSAIHESDLGDSYLKKTGDWMTGPFGLTENVGYGTTLPATGSEGQVFFLQDETDGNDLAEYRLSYEDNLIAGQVICENGDDSLSLSQERLQPAGNIISDTYGLIIGNLADNTYPVAIAGRVLAYPYEPRNEFKAGDAVCAGPNGTVSKMTREEIREYPERIIGTVSAIPNYEYWNKTVKVDNRIWIKV